jgi:protein-S-isoprenylcysteine O-methyltransferase Ste14
MNIGTLVFRFRSILLWAILLTGFWAPWVQMWAIGARTPLLEWLALETTRAGLLTFTVATPVVIVAGALVAALGVGLRLWGSAWLGPGVVVHTQMQGASLTADGPYRHVRNPLYLGAYCWIAALSLLMPATGALFALIGVALLSIILIRGEESFLKSKLGQPYIDYLHSVPRLFPRLRTTVAPSGSQPHWGHAFLSEILPIGVFITIAFLSWTYDHDLMIRAVIITFGLSLVMRALMPPVKQEPDLPR